MKIERDILNAQTFEIHCHDEEDRGFAKKVAGFLLDNIEGFTDDYFFLHEDRIDDGRKVWVISELTTGRKIAFGYDEESAYEKAVRRLEENNAIWSEAKKKAIAGIEESGCKYPLNTLI